MAQRTSGPYRRPRPDVYSALLGIALFAIIVGCIVLHLEMGDFGENPTSGVPMVHNQIQQPADFDVEVCLTDALRTARV